LFTVSFDVLGLRGEQFEVLDSVVEHDFVLVVHDHPPRYGAAVVLPHRVVLSDMFLLGTVPDAGIPGSL
jgi:hypothetical protein